jgi:hypothetical protein
MITRAQREGLANIRRLQREWLAMLVAGLALFLLSIVLVALDFQHLIRPTVTELHLASWEFFLFMSSMILIAASGYVASMIWTRPCPSCGEKFFVRSRRARADLRLESFPAGPLRQQCRNCGLSLGEVAVDSALQNP